MKRSKYACDLCGEPNQYDPGLFRGGKKLAGIDVNPVMGLQEVAPEDAERHLCWRCISAIQANFFVRCGAGYGGDSLPCSGGPNCDADHK